MTVTITSVACTQDDEYDEERLEALGESSPDFYARIFINGIKTLTPRAPDDNFSWKPLGWAATTVVDDVATPKGPITSQVWDQDPTRDDDLGNPSPQSDHNDLDLTLDLQRVLVG